MNDWANPAQTPEEFYAELASEEEALLMVAENRIVGMQHSPWRWRKPYKWETCPICGRWDCPEYLAFHRTTRAERANRFSPRPFDAYSESWRRS